MKTQPTSTFRLIAAVAAAATTYALFGSIVSIAEPQRSVLIAKIQRAEKAHTVAAAPSTLTVASNEVAQPAK